MKIALISDIHGNYHALEAVLEDIGGQRADRVIVLGDIVFKGPLPERCVQAVRALDTVVLRGNIDELVALNAIQDGFAKSAAHAEALRREMAWNRSRLSAADVAYLAALPLVHEQALAAGGGVPANRLRCVHATPQNVLDIVAPTLDEDGFSRMFVPSGDGVAPAVVAYGHIHVPYVRSFGGRLLFNTGSVGLPFDGDPRASYALLETGGGGETAVAIRRVRYDVEAAVRAFDGSGHPFAQSVIEAIRTGSRPV